MVINNHLEHEEQDVEPLMMLFEDEAEWKALTKKLRPGLGTTDAGQLAGLDAGRCGGAGARRAPGHDPRPVLALVSRVFGRRYAREVAPTWRA